MEGEAPGGALVALAAADDVAPLQIAEILLLRAGPQPEGGVEVRAEPVGGGLLRAARRGDDDAGRVVVVLRDAARAAELAARDGQRALVVGRGDAVQVVGGRVEDLHRAVARFVQVPDAGVAAPHAVDLVHGGVRSVVDADRRAFGDGRHLHPEAGLAVRVPVLELVRKRLVLGVRDEDVRAVLAEVGVVEALDAGAQADEQREVRERFVGKPGGDGDRERLGEVRRCNGVRPRRERGEDGNEGENLMLHVAFPRQGHACLKNAEEHNSIRGRPRAQPSIRCGGNGRRSTGGGRSPRAARQRARGSGGSGTGAAFTPSATRRARWTSRRRRKSS